MDGKSRQFVGSGQRSGRMKVITYRLIVSAMAAVSCGSGAIAQAAAPQPNPIPRAVFITTMDSEFKKMDADKNGSITRKEIEDFQRATSLVTAYQRNVGLFRALDKDKNGQLSPDEFAGLPMNAARPDAAPVLAQVDRNRDGQVTLIEFRSASSSISTRWTATRMVSSPWPKCGPPVSSNSQFN